MDVDEMMAREAIRDLVARYNAGADSGRFDDVTELFAPGAAMEIPGNRLEGRAEITAMFRDTQERVLPTSSPDSRPYVRHFTGTLQIDVEGPDRARSRCYYQVLMSHGLDHWGRYIDEYTRIGGDWRFVRRQVTVDGRRHDSPLARD